MPLSIRPQSGIEYNEGLPERLKRIAAADAEGVNFIKNRAVEELAKGNAAAQIVIDAADARINELTLARRELKQADVNRRDVVKAETVRKNAHNLLHRIGNYHVQYTDPRGRYWTVNVFKDGKYLTEAPLTPDVLTGKENEEVEVYFPSIDAANDYADRKEFMVATREMLRNSKGEHDWTNNYRQIARVVPTSKPTSFIQENGTKAFSVTACLIEIVDANT